MNLNLRQAIIQRVQGKDEAELLDIIDGSIDTDERTLPGLGVLFEIIWKHCEQNTREELVLTLKEHLA
ncbi:small acid-soluble spore protein SspI [Ferviditalea candida]|uniref:Small, acid-soluble spore protein I n=1 Tax=Ferviditalea candida TaxID=3108399 RepID=A0ABU5ZKS7_9BACL|nr:small acid-soluble spore protein SspI [Paenibacillaceae bacterium T2]